MSHHPEIAQLPDAGFVRLRQLIGSRPVTPDEAASNKRRGKGPRRPRAGIVGIVPLSCATLWRKVKDRSFPAPVRLSERVVAWAVEDVRTWLQSRSAQ